MITAASPRNTVIGDAADAATEGDSDGTISAKLRAIVKLTGETGETHNFASWGSPEQFSVREQQSALTAW